MLATKNKRIQDVQSAGFVDALSALPIVIDPSTTSRAMHSIFVLAHQSGLTIYNAAYLELAIREKIPLFMLDKELIKPAKKLQLPVNPI